MNKYLIIGASIAAASAIEAIRKNDKEGSITVIGKEPYAPYCRPLISYALLGKTTFEKMPYRDASFYKKMKAKLILGKEATSIDKAKKQVILDDGTRLPYDKLLVSTGSRPFVPPMEGLDKVEKKFSFMTIDDAKSLEKELDPEAKVLVVGAGLIGLKCCEGILAKVKSIDVVDLAPRILPSILDDKAAARVQDYLEGKGIRFFLKDSVASFTKKTATLKSGTKLTFDLLVLAVGVRPNTALVADIGGTVNRGIVTDDCCKTSIEDIYAAGDCTTSHDITSDSDKILALFPNANMQGEVAGNQMSGGTLRYDHAIAANAIGFFGLHIITAGSYIGDQLDLSTKDGYKVLFTKDDHLVGMILIGDTVLRAGIYTNLIRKQIPLSSLDFEQIAQQPRLMAFAKKDRVSMLGEKR
ncbi:MAG: FAD-dependent oxidoreductase [Spirochaetia bacterium]|nr:FAD-dependent oxidoreductase [Spirochaetia bacterium]